MSRQYLISDSGIKNSYPTTYIILFIEFSFSFSFLFRRMNLAFITGLLLFAAMVTATPTNRSHNSVSAQEIKVLKGGRGVAYLGRVP